MVFAPDLSVLLQALVRTDTPALPDAALRQICVQMLWGLLLAAAVWRAGSRMPARWRLGCAALTAAWAATPGPASAAYWLEMAFAAPSWTSALFCGLWLYGQRHQRADRAAQRAPTPAALISWPLAVIGMGLGWLLALDTFALLPWGDSLYAWGFSPLATAGMVLLAAAAWVMRPSWGSAVPVLAVALCALTRMPSGNVWDAVLDPFLWLYLHGALALQLWRWLGDRAKPTQ